MPVDRLAAPGTLGSVLYANSSKARPTEAEWVELVRAVAQGDQQALLGLYDRAHRLVFTLVMRLRTERETAETLTLDVFHDVGRRAMLYDPAQGTVLAWIMNLARARALTAEAASRRSGSALAAALGTLRLEELYELEAAYFAGLTYADANARPEQPLGSAKATIRTALQKLRRALGAEHALNPCVQSELTCAFALWALPPDDVPSAEQHIASCAHCERELAALMPIVAMFGAWPADMLRPNGALRERLARRISAAAGRKPPSHAAPRWTEPPWEEVAPGISVKMLAVDSERHLISMLVRLVPGGSYPAHSHAAVEELHLLNGELWIDDRKLYPGDYNRAEPGTGDKRVWSETGCACVLVTSTKDELK